MARLKKHKCGPGIYQQRMAYLFLAPALLILAVFVFFPLISSLVLSGLNIDIFMTQISFAGLDHFKQLFSDPRVGNATKNTFFFAFMEVPLQMLTALLLASLVSRNQRICRVLRSVYYLPFVCSMTAVSIVWSMLLDPNKGLVPYVLSQFGWGTIPFLKSAAYAMPTVIVITAWKGFGYTLTILSAAILNISPSLNEAAEIDGAGPLQRFLRITIPCIWPTLCFCIVTTMIGSLQVFDQVYIMTGGGPNFATETLVAYIYDRGFQTAPYSIGYASSIAVYLFFFIAAITFILRKFVLNRGEDEA